MYPFLSFTVILSVVIAALSENGEINLAKCQANSGKGSGSTFNTKLNENGHKNPELWIVPDSLSGPSPPDKQGSHSDSVKPTPKIKFW